MDKKVVERKLREVTEKIVKEFQPEKIILFGSWVWGKPGPDSDADLLIVKRSSDPRPQRELELNALLSHREIPFDFMVYTPEELDQSINKNGNLFIEDILRNGKTLYSKPGGISVALPSRPLTILR